MYVNNSVSCKRNEMHDKKDVTHTVLEVVFISFPNSMKILSFVTASHILYVHCRLASWYLRVCNPTQCFVTWGFRLLVGLQHVHVRVVSVADETRLRIIRFTKLQHVTSSGWEKKRYISVIGSENHYVVLRIFQYKCDCYYNRLLKGGW